MAVIKKLLSYCWPMVLAINRIKQWRSGEGIVVVLIYHDIPPQQQTIFAAQMRWLKQHYEVITPTQFDQYLSAKRVPKGIKVLLTFDDGFHSNRLVGEQVLNPLGVKAIFFVLPDLIVAAPERAEQIVKQSILAGASEHYCQGDLKTMSVVDVQWLIDHGHTLGSHTRQHLRLSSLTDAQQLQEEVIGSAQLLEKMFNVPIRHFAYPFGAVGDISNQAVQLACQRYDYIHSGVRGDNGYRHARKLIFRQEMAPEYSKRYMRFIIEGGLSPLYCKARRVLKAMEQ